MQLEKVDGYEHIYAADSFFDGYSKMFGKHKKKEEARYMEKLLVNLRILDSGGQYLGMQQFEKLKSSNLYAIRHVSKMNPRVIFFYQDEDGTVLLLHSFLEKSKSDYEAAIQKASHILKELGVNSDD